MEKPESERPPWNYLIQLANTLPKAKLTRAIQILSQGRKDRFIRVREPLYGDVFLGFEEHELARFLRALPNKYRILFLLQLTLYLIVGEAVALKVENFSPDRLSCIVRLQKGGRAQKKPIPFFLAGELKRYIKENLGKIASGGGYLFFSEDKFRGGKTEYPHLSPNHVRNKLRRVVRKLGMDEVYAISRNGRRLHRINTHSFKRTAATLTGEVTGNLAVTRALTGHKSADVLLNHYWKPSEKSKREAVNKVFGRL